MDCFNNFSFDWVGDTKVKIMQNIRSTFFKKKILIYGFAKSGSATLEFLRKKKSKIYCWDDSFLVRKKIKKKYLFNIKKKIPDNFFDYIFISQV